MELNAEQLAAVNAGPGAWCCLASAGSGKTRVLVERYKLLVAAGEDPRSILCLAFTRKAATEMRERAGAPIALLHPCGFRTFHSLAYAFDLTENCGLLASELISGAPDLNPSSIYSFMIASMVRFLKTCRPLQPWWQAKWIMIDEANDLTLEQVELLQLLSQKHGNVWICGDVNQAIFGFAGSTPEPMVHFDRYFPGGRTLTMGVNYRSTRSIVEFCRRLAPIQTELLDRLNTSNEQGEAPTFRQYETNVGEVYGVSVEMNPNMHPNESRVVLARTNRQLELFKSWNLPAMTIHKAKGLEFDNVWVIGCQDGYLPLTGADEEEESRLLFTAASRAAKRLHLSCYGTPSKFIQKFIEDGTIRRV